MLVTQNGTTREFLVAAAKQLLDEGGSEAVTLREVGRRASVSHNAVYRHFANRDALLVAAVDSDLEDLAHLFRDVAEIHPDPIAALRHALLHLVGFSRTRSGRYRAMFHDAHLRSSEDRVHAAFLSLEELVRRCQTEGLLRSDNLRATTSLVYATLHGLLHLDNRERAGECDTSEESIDLLLLLLQRS